MEKYRMADVIPLLPIPGPPQGRSAYYMPCPHCDRDSRKRDKHLNINLAKDVFRCARCGWNGGIFDLYAYYTESPRDKARDDIKRALSVDGKPSSAALQTSTPVNIETTITDVQNRHSVYSAFLSMLPLAPDHMRNLLGRGLTEQSIAENEYRTTPVVGEKTLVKRLLSDGHSLAGVPGFYTDRDGQWRYISMWRGILIPVRDIQGRIQGLQVRRDNQERRKYRWVSSADIEGGVNGCGAEGWIHLTGPVRDRVILIEGPLKADIVHHLTGQTVVAIPGVNSLRHLEVVLTELIGLGVKQVMTAFDMDFLKNPHVQNGYAELVSLLERMDLQFGTYMWNPDYNGLDDYVWECCLGRKQIV